MSQWPSWLPLSERLQPLSPYGAPQLPADAVLNTNESPFALSPELSRAIANRVEKVATNLNRYPDRDAVKLRSELAAFINELSGTSLTVENIWAANGSNEVIQSLFLAFGDKGALGFTPSYSMHPLIARVTNTSWVDGRRREDFSLDIEMAKSDIAQATPALTFITTPNNPTGSTVTIAEIEELAKIVPGLLVVDEAYAEFSDEVSAVTLIKKFPHVVVIRTMSKAFSYAGVRLGYLVADKSVIDALYLVRLPYHLSAITQAAAEVALEFKAELLGNVSTLIRNREWVREQLEGLGLTVVPSKSNFLLFSGFDIPAPTLWKSLLDAGVLIRDVGLSGYLRVTIGTDAENQLFIDAIAPLIKE
jgi:histidinol-phosphate aminotransferase